MTCIDHFGHFEAYEKHSMTCCSIVPTATMSTPITRQSAQSCVQWRSVRGPFAVIWG